MSPTLDGICTVSQNVPSGLTVSIKIFLYVVVFGMYSLLSIWTLNFKLKFESKYKTLLSTYSRQCIWKCCLQNASSILWPSDAIRWLGTESTLAQVMACCLAAPSHCLNQYLLVTSKVLWYLSKGNWTRYLSHQLLKLAWKLHILNLIQISQGPMS